MTDAATLSFRPSPYGVLRLTGADRAAFLHNMTTADVRRLPAGGHLAAATVNQRGVLVDWGWIHADAEAHWVVGHAGRLEQLAAWFDRYIITEDVQVEAPCPTAQSLFLTGPRAEEALAMAQGGRDPRRAWHIGGWGAPGVLVWAEDPEGLAASLRDHGVVPGSPEQAEQCRIASGVALPDREADERTNPWELRLDAAISLDKGCYLGQEVVARLRTYDKVQRALMGVEWDPAAPPPSPDTPLFLASDECRERPLGRITSVSPGTPVALAVVRKGEAREGLTVVWQGQAGGLREARLADRWAWTPGS